MDYMSTDLVLLVTNMGSQYQAALHNNLVKEIILKFPHLTLTKIND